MFVVPRGEVESWLPELGVTGRGPQWLIEMFRRMGSDQTDANYVRPNDTDVWAFMRGVGRWLQDRSRQGMADRA